MHGIGMKNWFGYPLKQKAQIARTLLPGLQFNRLPY